MNKEDLRWKKTERAIREAFLSLRKEYDVQKIRIKELCAIAHINKSTFYAHYEDVFVLSEALEDAFVISLCASFPSLESDYGLSYLCTLPAREKEHMDLLFSGDRENRLAEKLSRFAKKRILELHPEIASDPLAVAKLDYRLSGAYECWAKNRAHLSQADLVSAIRDWDALL